MTNGKINILLVDDQPANLLALESILEHPELNLIKSSSGDEALRWLLKEEFALVLLDVLMPGMDGFETAALIRSRESSMYTPIIFITAINTNETHVTRGYSLGAVDYIFKPIVPEILKAKVGVFVDLFKNSALIKRQASELQAALSEQQAAAKALAESEERYRRLYSSSSEAIILYEMPSGRVIDANESARRLYGYSKREFLKLNGVDLFPAFQKIDSLKTLRQAQVKKDGESFPAEITHGPLSVSGTELMMVLVRDLSERIKAEENERLRAREAVQRDFVATVSHELRTPIAAIRGFAETLRIGALDDKINRLRFVKIIERNAEKLGGLVEDLLTVAALESGNIKPEPELIPLAEFIKGCVENVAPLAARKAVGITIEVEAGTTVNADQRHLAQILQNLLDNAIKYNKRGGSIEIRARRSEGQTLVTVKDSGIGIAAKEVPLLFQQFHRLTNAKANAIGGTGLGLYIIKNYVESNGGRIWVESKKDQGTTFSFTLPTAPAASPLPAKA
jgi:PAS domain S-box-containing protein